MSDPIPIMRLYQNRSSGDCCICALAMYLGQTYEDVLVAASALIDPDVHNGGMYITQIRKVAKTMGTRLYTHRTWDMDNDEGILFMDDLRSLQAHVVVLKAGLLFDTNDCVWEPEVYFSSEKFKPRMLLSTEK